MTPERFNKIKFVLDRRQPDLTVITDQVHKQRNLAAIVRNCDAVGIDTIHSVIPKEGFQIYAGTAASANKWVNIKYYSNITEPIANLKENGFQVLSASLSEKSIDYRDIDYTKKTALVMGAEIKGISIEAAAETDHQIVLPMLGMVESYNVSVACALILSEAQHQRESAGFYNQPRLDKETYDKRFFNWAHPKVSEYCDAKGIEYPSVGDDGEINDASKWYKSVRQ